MMQKNFGFRLQNYEMFSILQNFFSIRTLFVLLNGNWFIEYWQK